MQNSYSENIVPTNNNNNQSNASTIIKTDLGAKDGHNKCPKCGSTDIALNVNNGKLRCNFCRHEFEPEKLDNMQQDLSQLQGQVMGSGATDIVADTKDIVTFKCSSCGAEIVIDTASSTQARCHWCRNILSVNQQISNGSAHPKFKQEFTTDNIMGVYLPYMIIDANAHVNLVGNGEHLTRTYYRGSGENRSTYYDADLYHVEREFDLIIQGLTVESSTEKLNNSSANATNNVINAIMPFDLENCVKFNANYLKGYTSEKRDINIDQLRPLVDKQSKDIAKFAANNTLKQYDRGVAWHNEQLDVKGQQWKAAYLPVWLYSYLQVSGEKKVLHYVAVNARTKETMGSVPIHIPKLLGISFLVEILGIIAMLFIDFDYNWAFLLAGFIYFFVMFTRYRNSNARHKYETETKTNLTNLRKIDNFIKTETGLTNSRINGANNTSISGQGLGSQILNSFVDQNPVANLIKDSTNQKGEK